MHLCDFSIQYYEKVWKVFKVKEALEAKTVKTKYCLLEREVASGERRKLGDCQS